VDTSKHAPHVSDWFNRVAPAVNPQPNFNPRYTRNPQEGTNIDYPIRGAMFFDTLYQGRGGDQNSGLRMLDQSLRLKRAGDVKEAKEAILVARLPVQHGPAEEKSKHLASATRLWLGALPMPGTPRPNLEGILQQDTYIRVILPVQ
jgi:hypothetical protein